MWATIWELQGTYPPSATPHYLACRLRASQPHNEFWGELGGSPPGRILAISNGAYGSISESDALHLRSSCHPAMALACNGKKKALQSGSPRAMYLNIWSSTFNIGVLLSMAQEVLATLLLQPMLHDRFLSMFYRVRREWCIFTANPVNVPGEEEFSWRGCRELVSGNYLLPPRPSRGSMRV